MENLGIRATIYDIVGYGVPGLIFVTCSGALYFPELVKIDDFLSLKLEWPAAVFILTTAYLAGHFLSAIGACIMENKRTADFFGRTYIGDMTQYDTAAIKLFGKAYAACEFRQIAVHCQSKHPATYETAFVFLAIYGLNRNVFSGMLILFPKILFSSENLNVVIIYFGVMLLFFYNYIRFRKNYLHQIAAPLSSS